MTAKGFRAGQRFKFPDDTRIYTFEYITYVAGVPVVGFLNEDDILSERRGYDLFDLIHA